MSPRAEPVSGVEARTTTRVRYSETDRMGVAHHTHYLVWFELGRTELMRELGCTYGELEDRSRVYFPVIRAEAVYRAAARYDERVVIRTRLEAVQGARVRFGYRVSRESDGQLLAEGATEHASVGPDGAPRRIPDWLRKNLRGEEVTR